MISEQLVAEYKGKLSAIQRNCEDVVAAFIDAAIKNNLTIEEIAAGIKQIAREYDNLFSVAGADFFETTVTGAKATVYNDVLKWSNEYFCDLVKTLYSQGVPLQDTVRAFARKVGGKCKQSANRTVTRNAKHYEKKGVRFARVPTGNETCGFCIVLASRGFVYHSEQNAGGGFSPNHYHDNCDCIVVASNERSPSIEGYSEQPYADMYDKAKEMAGCGSNKDVLNAMNRLNYDNIKDSRNTRRRELYKQKHADDKNAL